MMVEHMTHIDLYFYSDLLNELFNITSKKISNLIGKILVLLALTLNHFVKMATDSKLRHFCTVGSFKLFDLSCHSDKQKTDQI